MSSILIIYATLRKPDSTIPLTWTYRVSHIDRTPVRLSLLLFNISVLQGVISYQPVQWLRYEDVLDKWLGKEEHSFLIRDVLS